MLLCRVTLGKSFLQFSAMKMAHAPPGHHSVIGRPSTGGLTYAEYVVYRGEQVTRHCCLCMVTVAAYTFKKVSVMCCQIWQKLRR